MRIITDMPPSRDPREPRPLRDLAQTENDGRSLAERYRDERFDAVCPWGPGNTRAGRKPHAG